MDSNFLHEINQNIANSILSSVDLSKNKDVFMLLLNGIKDNCELCGLLNQSIIKESLDALKLFDEEYEKAHIINCLLNIFCNLEYDYKKNKNEIDSLLEFYLGAINRGYSGLENIYETLSLFNHLGVENKHIISELLQYCNEELLVHIFLKMGTDFIKDVGELYPELGILLERKLKLSKRFELLFHFYLMTNVQYYENIDIVRDYLKPYSNYVSICADWAFSSRNAFNHKYVLDNIITEEEEKVFIAIGDLFYSCLDESASDEEELFKSLKNASEKFYSKLKTEETQEIINGLIQERHFFEAALSLPK